MYAAAGGASLASRQARQRQRQNKKLQQQQQQSKITPQQQQQQQLQLQQKQQNKLYHNYTDDAISKLSRVERGALLRLPQSQQQHERRHSASNYNLKDPISSGSGVGGVISGALTTTNRLKGSPSISIPVQQSHHKYIENHITTTTNAVSTSSLQLPQILLPLPGDGGNKLERRCSFVRQVEEELERSQQQQQNQQQENVGLLDRCHHLSNFEIKESFYHTNTDLNTKEIFGSLDYPFSECSQGRAAWQERERERRCSLTDDPYQHRLKQSEAHHRWMKRNRIHDLSYGGDSEDYDFFSIYYQSAAANALLYVGLGTIAIGSVIFFVGTGDKGFKTVELRLIGPTMVACGFLCCLIRVLLCACPASTCFQRHQQQNRRKKKKKTRLDDELCTHQSTHKYPSSSKNRQHIEFPTDNSTSLLLDRQTNNNNNNKKRVSIVPPQPPNDNNDNKDNNINNNNNNNTGAISNIIFIPKINLPKTNNSSNSSNNNNDNNDNKQSSTIQICDDDDDNDDIINIELDDDDDIDNIIDNTNDIQSISSIESYCNDNNNDNRTNIDDNIEQVETYLKVIIENNSDDNNIVSSDNTSNNGLGDGNCGASCTNLDNDNKIVTHSGIVLSPLQLQQ